MPYDPNANTGSDPSANPIVEVYTGPSAYDQGVTTDSQTRATGTYGGMQPAADYAATTIKNMSKQELKHLQELLIKAKYLPAGEATGMFGRDTQTAYAALLNDTALENTRDSGAHVTPMDYLRGVAQQMQKDGTSGGSTGAGTFTSTNVTESAPQDAYAAAESEYQSLLGRDPSREDVAALHGALNAYEQAHATVTTDVRDGKGNSSSTTTGGTGSGYGNTMAEQYADDHHGGEGAMVQIQRLAAMFSSMLGGG